MSDIALVWQRKEVLSLFSENLKTLRKQKGMSQETLAQQLNVVRQTISKWEKGLSVPDAEMLTKIADLFEVSVSELLGSKIENEKEINEVATQLALLNEQLANRSRRTHKIIKTILITILVIILIIFMYSLLFTVSVTKHSTTQTEQTKIYEKDEIK